MTVVTDKPITKIADDRFGRSEFAKRIAGVISSLKDKSSIVVSVNAPWGEGKTSVLKMIEEELSNSENSIVVWFNPWRFPDENQLLLNFFQTLDSHLKFKLKGVSEKIGEGFKDIVTFLSGIEVMGFALGGGVKNVAEKRLPGTDIEGATTKVKDALQESPKKIVIFMDDIDRLDSREVQAVFRLVKLTADFPNTAYILAFDDEKVAASLADQFGGEEAGRSFLEKIVQVSLPVPPADSKVLRRMVFDGVDSALNSIGAELSQEEARQFVTVFDKSFSRMFSSPRTVKRFTNMLNFALPILKSEVNNLDLILIEGR
jgi:predicted KAP-like P-loop ATPase